MGTPCAFGRSIVPGGVDLSGRPGLHYRVDYTRARVGDFDVICYGSSFRFGEPRHDDPASG